MRNQSNEYNKWSKFAAEISKLILFWTFGIIFFQINRLILILLFNSQVGINSRWLDYYKTIAMGFRFDATVIAYFIFLPLIATFLFAPFNKINYATYIRKIFQILFIVGATIICVVTINYFREYNDQFNHFLFVGLYDDKRAIFETIYTHFYPFLNLIIIISVIIGCIYFFKYFEKKKLFSKYIQNIKRTPFRMIFVVLILILFVGSIRGSFGRRPAMRKWSYVTKDHFLNKTIINPFRSLDYAISDFNKINKINGDNPFGDVKKHFENIENKTISDFITKISKGATIQKPHHIFLIIMESLDLWPLLDEYSEFNIVPNLKYYSVHGKSYINFLPSSNSTMNSFTAIITGIPYAGVNISKIGAVNGPYPTSIFTQFKNIGYETNFFYGGFLSWQNIGNFVENQGADNSYSAADAGGKTESGVWGIDDEMLFNLVLESINDDRNSLNIILTTSYHPPYTIDVYEKGYLYKNEEDLPLKAQEHYDGAMSILALGHLWYSDKAIGDFVIEAESKFPNSIFCFTGDHFGRRFINSYPNLQEKSQVPFIVYGNEIAPEINDTPGSHFDIPPTLIEMIAPKDFEYFAFGNSLNNQKNKIGIGYQKIISKDELQYFPAGSDVQSFDLTSKNTFYRKDSEYISEYKKLLSLAWHYTVWGDTIDVQ